MQEPHLSYCRCAVCSEWAGPPGVYYLPAELRWAQPGSSMFKSRRLSSESSLPPPDSDDAASESSDDLMGSQSRLWLMKMGTLGVPLEGGEVDTVGRDGLCVDNHFPVGKLEMEAGVRWMRPKVKTPDSGGRVPKQTKTNWSKSSFTSTYFYSGKKLQEITQVEVKSIW